MKQITKAQIAALWLCLLYFGVTLAVVASRAMWGFLRLGSEYRDAQVPRDVLLGVANSAARDFRLHALLIAAGFVMLGSVLAWVSRNQNAAGPEV